VASTPSVPAPRDLPGLELRPPAGSSLIILYSNNFMLDDADTHLTARRRAARRPDPLSWRADAAHLALERRGSSDR
jgi:hypothetical protein